MKITSVDIPKDFDSTKNYGLEDIKMDKLQQVVLLAGQNGSGKTRILNTIAKLLDSKPSDKQIDSWKKRVELLEKENFHLRNKLSSRNLKEIMSSSKYNEEIVQNTNEINVIKNGMSWNYIRTDKLNEQYKPIYFVPKDLNLLDSSEFGRSKLSRASEGTKQLGVERLAEGTFAAIQSIQDKWFEATHPLSSLSIEEKTLAIESYNRLCSLIEILLGTQLTRKNDLIALFGRQAIDVNLSDGQIIILQYCIAIFNQESNLGECIIFLDEPENHIHPSILIETIQRIIDSAKKGQVWIATHSIPLLSYFDPSMIWYVEKGKISYAGKAPEKVLESLLGNDDEISKLRDFIDLPSQLATSRFAIESLFESPAVVTPSSDPQSNQLRKDLLEHSTNGVLTVLEYGAGKGRLISNLADIDSNNAERITSQMDFIAFDEFDTDKSFCVAALEKVYGTCKDKYFNKMKDLLVKYDKGTFDVVIMCNVLHEIDPIEWIKLFKNNGKISSLLKEDGFLFLIEDHQLPTGEKAYRNGFLVLDTLQIKQLFKISELDTGFEEKRSDEKNYAPGRLKLHKIPKKCLTRIDLKSRIDAIESLSNRAKSEISDIRTKDKSYKNGKLHGFWTQQFANAELSLLDLRK